MRGSRGPGDREGSHAEFNNNNNKDQINIYNVLESVVGFHYELTCLVFMILRQEVLLSFLLYR